MTVALLVLAVLAGFYVLVTLAHSRSGGFRRGLANGVDIAASVSIRAVQRNALITRPTTLTTRKSPGRDVGIEIGWARWSGRRARPMYAGFRDIVLVVAPPGTGKTGHLAGNVQDAPGAVFAASSRSDLYRESVESRARRPVHVFNPDGIGGVESTVRWSPVHGCRNPQYAALVAGYLVSGASTDGMKDAEFWQDVSHRALRLLLAAADIGGYTISDVGQWAADLSPGNTRPANILDRDGAPAGWAADLRKLQQMPDKTRGSISTTIATSLKFLAIPELERIATPPRGEQFDVAEYLRTGAALYVIGKAREHDPVTPLFAAFTGVVFETAVQIAEHLPKGRLDPPMLAVLDEVTNIFRVPLDTWTSFAGGNGIPMVIAAQGRHQLRKAFGAEGEKAIWSNAAVHIAFAGDMDKETLEELSTLCGDRPHLMGSETRRPILTPRDILQLRDGETLILRRNTPPIIGRSVPVWDRKHPPVAEPLVQAAETPADASNVVPFARQPKKAA